MAVSEFAENYHKKMFPGYVSDFKRTDPEFIERFDNFAFDEVINQPEAEIDERTRYLAILSVLMGSQAVDQFRAIVGAAMEFGLKPVEIKEVVYQAVAYLGMGRVLPFLKAVNEIFTEKGIALPLEFQGTTEPDKESRQKAGTEAQVEIFGESMKDFYNGGHINYWLADYCFGDWYTRRGLSLADRELITFCFLYAQGGCENQMRGHAAGNFRVGNDAGFLKKVVSACVPFIGFPRSLNAIAIIDECSNKTE